MTENKAKTKCLILFAREPVVGKVKKRLIPALGAEGAQILYKQMLKQQMQLLDSCINIERELWVVGDTNHESFRDFNGKIFQQQGENLGERMLFAVQQTLALHGSAVIIGSDCPGINTSYLGEAYTALDDGFDVVVGPAIDGGYVLIGLQECKNEIFSDIDWGTDRVLEQTRFRMRSLHLTWKELGPLRDIDEPDDLAHLSGTGLQEFIYYQSAED